MSPRQQESSSSKGGARSRWHSSKTDLSAYRPPPEPTQGSYRAGARHTDLSAYQPSNAPAPGERRTGTPGADLSKYQPSDSPGPAGAARPRPSQPSFEQGRNKPDPGNGKIGKLPPSRRMGDVVTTGVAHPSGDYVGRSGGTSGHEVANDTRAPKATSTGGGSNQAGKKGQVKTAGPRESDSSDGRRVGPHEQQQPHQQGRWKHPGFQGEDSRTQISQTKEVNSRTVRSDGGHTGMPSQQEQSQQFQPRNQVPQQQQPQSQPQQQLPVSQLQQYEQQYTPQQQQQPPVTSQHVQSVSSSVGNSGFAPYQQTYSQQPGAAPVSAAAPGVTAAPTPYGAVGMQGANKTSARPETVAQPVPISGYYGGNDTTNSTAASGSAAPTASTINVAGSSGNRQWLTQGQAQAAQTTSVQQVAQPAYAVSQYQQHAPYSATPAQQGSTQYGATSTATAPPNQGVAQVTTTPATVPSLVQNSSGTGVQNYSLASMQSATVSYQQQAQSNVQVCCKRRRPAFVTV